MCTRACFISQAVLALLPCKGLTSLAGQPYFPSCACAGERGRALSPAHAHEEKYVFACALRDMIILRESLGTRPCSGRDQSVLLTDGLLHSVFLYCYRFPFTQRFLQTTHCHPLMISSFYTMHDSQSVKM